MALDDPLQLIAIAVIVIVFLMWGPKKIPELARSIGLARREFQDASKTGATSAGSSSSTSNVVGLAVQDAANAPGGDPLIAIAKRLGLPTEGKTRDEVSDEIQQKSRAVP